MSGYEGTKTEVINEKNGNSKYLNDTKTGKKLKSFFLANLYSVLRLVF